MIVHLRRVSTFFLIVLFMLSLAVTFMMVTMRPAFASDTTPEAPVTVNELTPQLVAGLIGALVPLLVSLLARVNASPQVKVFINLFLTAAVGATSALVVNVDGGPPQFGWVPFLTAWLYAFMSSTIAYLGALKNFHLNDVLLAIGGFFGQKPDITGAHELAGIPDPPADTTPAGG